MKSLFYLTLFFAGLWSLFSCNEDRFVDPDPVESVRYTTVRGRVINGADQQPAPNVLVTLSPNSRVLSTSSTGEFRFDSVLAGAYTLQAAKVGFTSPVAAVTVTAAALPLITLVLAQDSIPGTPNAPNIAPTVPTLIAPAVNSPISSTSTTLKWTATDPDQDTLTYDVLLFKAGATTPTASFTGLTVDTLALANLDYSTTYLWQVIVNDGVSKVNGPVWSFVTNAYPNYNYTFARLINGQYQIFASNATGSAAQLTQNGSNWRPTVSPNGQQIAFISNANTDLHLFIMNLDGSGIRQVTTVPIAGLYQTDLSFSWSPDGSQLLYPSNNRLYAVRTDGTGLRTVAQAPAGRIFAGCDWTPQGNRIAARTTGTTVYDNEITTFQADGSDIRSVYTRRSSRVGNPVFSVTGRQLVFSADSTEFMNEQGRQLDARIYLLDLNSNGITDLSVDQSTGPSVSGRIDKIRGTNDLDPRFSPNGAQIIFTNIDNSGGGTRSVYTMDANPTGANNRKLLFTSAEMPYWRQP